MSAPDLEIAAAEQRARMFSDILALAGEFIRRRDMADRLNANRHEYTHHAIETADRMRNRAEEALTNWIAEKFATARRVAEPVPMILFCPSCGEQHIDKAAEPPRLANGNVAHGCEMCDGDDECTCPGSHPRWWTNPPHRSHLCHGCGHIWRPADVATVGVREIATKGKADSAPAYPARRVAEMEGALQWHPIETAPKDGRLLDLWVKFDGEGDAHCLEDASECVTIGQNNFDNDGEDRWQFAGWCWTHDHFTEGHGTPTHWRERNVEPPNAALAPSEQPKEVGT